MVLSPGGSGGGLGPGKLGGGFGSGLEGGDGMPKAPSGSGGGLSDGGRIIREIMKKNHMSQKFCDKRGFSISEM